MNDPPPSFRLEAGSSCRLRGHRAYTCPLPRLTGVTFIFLADTQDVRALFVQTCHEVADMEVGDVVHVIGAQACVVKV